MRESGDTFNMRSSLRKSSEYGTDVSTLLHGNDSELIFFVHPDEESLLVVMEDSSSLWPVSVEATGVKESIAFLEEEVIIDQLLLLSRSHGAEGIECASKLTSESVASLNDLLLDLISLLSGDSRAKRVSFQVTPDSDTSGLDHSCILSWEWWALKLGVIHV